MTDILNLPFFPFHFFNDPFSVTEAFFQSFPRLGTALTERRGGRVSMRQGSFGAANGNLQSKRITAGQKIWKVSEMKLVYMYPAPSFGVPNGSVTGCQFTIP